MSFDGVARDPTARIARHGRVSAALAAQSDSELSASIGSAGHVGAGIGGAHATLDVCGVPVFAKRLPLTDRERRADAVRSTANLFGLPARCHFGVGSPGFGAWRELAATTTASAWVLSGRSESFPLLHHWRVLPGAAPLGDDLADIDAAVAYWGDDPAMRDRLGALADASASVVLFLEHIPHTLTAWLASATSTDAVATLEAQLLDAAAFMTTHGMIHFDAHFDNVLTDGRRLHIADFGLALTDGFALSADEAALAEQARTHDVGYAIARLVNWLVASFGDPSFRNDPVARNAHLESVARGAEPVDLPESAAATVRRHARIACLVNAFYAELFTVRRDARYPTRAVEDELARLAREGRVPRSLSTFGRH